MNKMQEFYDRTRSYKMELDIFFPADKVFAKAEKIFKGPVTTMKIDSLHLPDDATMEEVCKKTAEFFYVRNF